MSSLSIPFDAFATLMPMHLAFDAAGRIAHVGSVIDAMAPATQGGTLSEALTIRRPQCAAAPADILALAGRRLMIDLHLPAAPDADGPSTQQRLRGVVVPLPMGGGLINFAFGPDIKNAVQRHGLSATDFSPVDPVLDILYILEAQTLIRDDLRALTERLDRALRVAESNAETDRLTGLGNRRAMDRRLGALLDRAASIGIGIMHLDLDHFKRVNDTFGHAAGDAVLSEVANILREETRRDDIVCRMGGDEFILIFPNCADPDILAGIATRILQRLTHPIPFEDCECQVAGSIGIALSSSYAKPQIDELLADADAALYRSKRAGRGRFAFHMGRAEANEADADQSAAPIPVAPPPLRSAS